MGLYEQLLDLPSTVKRDGSLAELIEIEYSKRLKQSGRPKEYYYLTDLCNPIQAYWREKKPETPRSDEVARKLARGNRLQRIAFSWMRKMPGYTCEETHLFGEYQRIQRVVGKYDMRLADSIIEFKTKPGIVTDEETVFRSYPQDLEQLLFYAALSPRGAKTHYLVFQLDHQPYSLAVFRVDIKDLGKIRTILRQRRDNLDHALQESAPSSLGKCRYHGSGCDFDSSGVCQCSSMEDINLEAIRNAISLSKDEKKRAEYEHFMETSGKSPGELYHVWSLLTPRRHVLNCLCGTSEDYEKDDSVASSEESLRKAVHRTIALKPTASELEESRAKCLDLPILPSWKWIAIHGPWSGDRRRRTIPALLKVNQSNRPSITLNETYKAQLNIARIACRNLQGSVIVAYPNAGDVIQAFTVSSQPDDLRATEKSLRKAVFSLDAAVRNGDIRNLDLCPRWFREKCKPCPAYCEDLCRMRTIPQSTL